MPKVLIIEDEEAKLNEIEGVISSYFCDHKVEFVKCSIFATAAKSIYENRFDLIVTDLMLPRRLGDEPSDFSNDLLDFLANSDLNSSAVVVAISQYDGIIKEQAEAFRRFGIFLLDYQNDLEWRSCLKICMQRVEQRQAFDFAIICALEEERAGFRDVGDLVTFGALQKYHGLDCRDIEIDGLQGVCVLQPRMGLVDAAAISSQVLSAFRPRLICMSGICAGFEDEVELGTLLISDPCWEHQSGKWKGDDFKMSHYQEPLQNEVRTVLSQLIEEEPSCKNLRVGLHGIDQEVDRAAIIAPTVTGSAVIASKNRADTIREQHRKVGGLDMEVYGLYRAAAIHSENVIYFAAKTAVDLATEAKGDDLHNVGAVFSARFVVKAIQRLLCG